MFESKDTLYNITLDSTYYTTYYTSKLSKQEIECYKGQ